MTHARILIVEDDPAAAKLTDILLRAAGYPVVGVAATGQEALVLADSTRPDLVIMDMILPGDLDDIQTAGILAQRHDIPVLYLTAYSKETLFERARATSPWAYLAKPFNEQELRHAIEVTVDRHQLLRRLKTSEAHLREAQAVARMGSWHWDMVHDRVEMSDELLRLLNLTPGNFEPRFETFLQLACAEDRAKMLQAVELHLRGEDPGDVDLRVHDAATPARVLRLRGSPRFDTQGKLIALLGTARDLTERRAMEWAAERFRVALDSSPDAVCLIDPETMGFVDVNSTACACLGYSREELLALDPQDVKPHFNKAMLCQHFAEVLAGQPGSEIVQTEHRRKDGSLYPVEIRLRPFRSGGKNLIVAVARDITARQEAEETLKRSESRYRSLVSSLPGIAYRRALDLDWTMEVMSSETERLTGYSASDFLARIRSFDSIIHPDDRAHVRHQVEMAVARKQKFNLEYRLLHADGHTVIVHENGHGVFDDQGRLLWLDGFIWGVTERKLMEEALRASEARVRAMLLAAPVGIGVLVKQVFHEVNETMTAMTGYTRAELLGQSARMLYATQEDFDHVGTEKYRQIREQGVGLVETRWRCKDGAMIHVALSSAPIVAGELGQGVVFTVQDITATKEAEQDRLKHEARQRDALVREVHHRIKNNLQGVIGLLRQQVAEAPAIREPMEAAIAQINTISVVHGLQSRTPRHEPRLRELLIEVCQAAATLALASTPPPLQDVLAGDVWLDSGSTVSIALVLNELMQNAFKHSDGLGSPDLSVVIYGDVTRAVIRISNPGTALPEAFDFAQGTGLGTGLGLVHTLLPSHGATLTISYDGTQVNAELILTPPVISAPPLNGTPSENQESP